MRRLNIRKRNLTDHKRLNKKTLKTIYILVVLLIIFSCIYFYFFKNIFIKHIFEKEYTTLANLNEETIFSLDKIIIFSSVTADSKELNNSVWNLDISQYSDIGIYLNNVSNENGAKNTVINLYIDHINLSTPEYGIPHLYQKSLQDFGKCSFSEDKIIKNKLDFPIISENEDINYENNELNSSLSTPITIGFYNKNIKENFLDADEVIEYNGKLLKRANIPQTSLKCNISFDIHIINELSEEYVCNVNFEIPFENDSHSIYEDGYLTQEINHLEKYKFLRVK